MSASLHGLDSFCKKRLIFELSFTPGFSRVSAKENELKAFQRFPAFRLDESPVGYSLAGCSPAEPASASPTGRTLQQWRGALQLAFRRFLFTTLSRGLTLGAHPSDVWSPGLGPV